MPRIELVRPRTCYLANAMVIVYWAVIALIPILALAVLMVIGWILFRYFSSPHATTLNAFLFALGALVGAYAFTVLAFVTTGLMKISLSPDTQSGLARLSLVIGTLFGGSAVIWLKLRKKREPKEGRPS